MDDKIKEVPAGGANSLEFNREWAEGISPEAYEGITKQARLEALREARTAIKSLTIEKVGNSSFTQRQCFDVVDNLITQTENG
jgi:hypothetical protein